jgi:virulence-associated protein VapD
VEQTKEVYDFFKDKFTDLGLYDYLAVSLNRLYREAYNLAYDMAKLAERAYRFERDDDTLYIETDNWQADRAGLLSGERLLLQLQQMEKSFIEKNVRDYEINQSFSMRQINPVALIQLQETGMCDFSIPEIVFDLFYPGQYKRRIKSVRMTIPCVTGPYTNVSCKLTLLKSEIRKDPETDTSGTDTKRIDVPYQNNTSVATSNANNDGGVFELNFRDERYMPFEGAGAISNWKLELPGVFRHFDYNSISDVIFHISYTAKDDGVFKETVEKELQGTLMDYAIDHDLIRLFSMKHEFSNELHRFLYPPTEEADQEITMTIDRKNFPYFLHDETISVQQVELILKLKPGCELSGQTIIALARGTDAPTGGEALEPYSDPEDSDFADLYKRTFDSISGEISDGDQWTLKAFDLDPDVVEDIGLLFYYTISAE